MAQHRRIGSPVPAYLRPGVSADRVHESIRATVGVDPPADVVNPFVWHDGIDDKAWERDDVATGFARLFGDAYFAPLASAIRHYRERIEGDEITARYSMPGEALQTWKPSWFPVFSEGWETYGIECDPGSPDLGRVYDPPGTRPPASGRGRGSGTCSIWSSRRSGGSRPTAIGGTPSRGFSRSEGRSSSHSSNARSPRLEPESGIRRLKAPPLHDDRPRQNPRF
jgi:hypothetical protein